MTAGAQHKITGSTCTRFLDSIQICYSKLLRVHARSFSHIAGSRRSNVRVCPFSPLPMLPLVLV